VRQIRQALKHAALSSRLRRQCGSPWPNYRRSALYDQSAAISSHLQIYHANAASDPERIVVRPRRGYLATNYDHSTAISLKTLRRQFGRVYDEKKVRNTSMPAFVRMV
jgi:hypothetical protein